jgi:hypothetical protein
MYTTRLVKMIRLIFPSYLTNLVPWVWFADFNLHGCKIVTSAKSSF